MSLVLHRQRDSFLGGVLPKEWQFERLTDRLLQRDHVYMYSEQFDEQIHEELKRMRRVVSIGMLDQLRYGNSLQRELTDFVYMDVLNEKETQSDTVERLAKYIIDTY